MKIVIRLAGPCSLTGHLLPPARDPGGQPGPATLAARMPHHTAARAARCCSVRRRRQAPEHAQSATSARRRRRWRTSCTRRVARCRERAQEPAGRPDLEQVHHEQAEAEAAGHVHGEDGPREPVSRPGTQPRAGTWPRCRCRRRRRCCQVGRARSGGAGADGPEPARRASGPALGTRALRPAQLPPPGRPARLRL